MKETTPPATLSLLKWACCIELLGKSYQHFFFPPSYSPIWNQGPDGLIATLPILFACAYFFCGIAVLFANKNNNWVKWPLGISTLLLVIWVWTKFVASGFQIPQLIELELQGSMPLLIWLWVYENEERLSWFLIRLAIALTFLGHGWYASGILYDVPNHFITMVLNSLSFTGITEAGARKLLLFAGLMDSLVAISLFVPRLTRTAAAYAILWGFLTSAARIVSYVRFGPEFWMTLHRWGFEFLVRVPHFVAPLFVWGKAQGYTHGSSQSGSPSQASDIDRIKKS